MDDYKDGLDNHCRLVFNFFCDIYAHILPTGTKEGLQQEPDAVSKLRFLCQKCQEVGNFGKKEEKEEDEAELDAIE